QVQYVGNVRQRYPVELDVLPRREVAIALVVLVRDQRELAQPRRVQLAIRNRDPEHVGVQLQIDAVLQAQRLEMLFPDLAAKTALHLPAELLGALPDQRVVVFVVAIHQAAFFACPMPRSLSTRATQRCTFGNSARSKPPSSAQRV